jgi:hypothetical protein
MAIPQVGIKVENGAYDSAFQQQRARQEEAADASQALGSDVVSPGAPIKVDTTPGTGLNLYA